MSDLANRCKTTVAHTWAAMCQYVSPRRPRPHWVVALLWALIVALAIEAAHLTLDWRTRLQTTRALDRLSEACATITGYTKDGQEIPLGIGVFISPDGRLLMRYQPQRALKLEARLRSGAYYRGTPAREYPQYGLSVPQFEGQGIPYISLGDSATVAARQQAYALVSSQGHCDVPARVMIQGKRSSEATDVKEFIELSAPSTSMGVFDLKGQIVGFVPSTSIIPESLKRQVVDVFAIPINRVRPAIEGGEQGTAENVAEDLYSRGVLAENKKQYDVAIALFDKAIQLSPGYADAYLELGGVYYELGDFDKQLEMYQKAAVFAPKDFDILYYLATAYEDKGMYDQAIAQYESTLRLRPDHKDSLYQLAILCLMQGDKEKAAALASRLEHVDSGLAGEITTLLQKMH
jgi:tetratricopeptide (TPR) repeat protein